MFERGVGHLLAALPAIATAIVLLAVSWIAGKFVGQMVCRLIARTVHEEDLARGLGNITQFVVVLIGVLIASVVIFPSVKPADVLAFLGLGSVAAGFAFKDIFQNFLAGILILFRRPFRLGDQIRSGDTEGTVEDVNLRATIIETYTGERVIIPNSDVYSKAVLVRTAYGRRRTSFTVGIGYGDDLRRAKAVLMAMLTETEGVLEEPAPWIRTVDLAPSDVKLEVFFWTQAQQANVLAVGDRVVTGIKYALDEAGIDMPYPVRRVLLAERASGITPSTRPPSSA